MGDVIEILTTATNTVEVEAQGPQGIPGVGVPTGGSTGQVLRKASGEDYATEWAAAGSGSGSVTSVALASTDFTITGSPITSSGTITANIAANAVTLEKLQTISSEHLLGRHGSGNGGVQQIGLGTGLAISGSNVRVATTGITAGTYTKLTIDETGRATVGATATPSDIGAQSLFETQNLTLTTDTELTANRAKQYNVIRLNSLTITLPTTGHLTGDIVVIYNIPAGNGTLTIRRGGASESFWTLTAAEQLRWRATGTGASDWELVRVDSHSADRITSGTLDIARIPTGTGSTQVALGNHTHTPSEVGLGNVSNTAQVTSVSGTAPIVSSGGTTPAISISAATTSAAGSMSAADKTKLDGIAAGATANSSDATLLNRANHTGTQAANTITGLAASATTDTTSASNISSGTLGIARIPTGTTSSTVALGNHSHELTALAATGATNGHVLTANGSGGVTFAAASGGLTGIASSASQVLATSSGNITGVDGNTVDSADPFIKWNDTAARLEYANPLSRPAGAMYVGVSPTTTALGTRAINIQADRSLAASRVATGTDSVLVGNSGEATATQSTALGHRARATGNYSFCAGSESIAQGLNSICLGYAHGASATDSVAIGSYDSFSAASFGASAQNTLGVHDVANLRGQVSFRPFRSVYWGGQTTDATANVTLNLDATGTNPMTIAANTAVIADISLIARRTDNTKFLAARRWVAIRRDGSNNTALIGAVQTIGTDQSEGSPTWTFTIDADDTASVESLRVRVTGAASETVNWRVCAIYRVVA